MRTWLFAKQDGGKIITLIDQFDECLKWANITYNSHLEKYTLHSLRNFYVVMALRKGLVVFEGASVQMIQKYYGKQATASPFATSLGD